jgi:hypothetical protein
MDHYQTLTITPPPTQSHEIDPLRVELGWPEVQSGLLRVLLGNLAVVVLPGIGLGMIILAIAQGGDLVKFLTSTTENGKINYETEFLFIGGFLFILATGLVSYALLLNGHWRCVMNAPERCNAKWLIFVCMLALLAGPALNLGVGILGSGKSSKEMQSTLKAVKDGNIWKSPTIHYDLASVIISAIGIGCFGLFLRSIAICFNNGPLLWAVNLFLLLMMGLVWLASFLLLGGLSVPQLARGGAMLLAGLFVGFVWYLVLLGWASSCISAGLASVRDPLDTPPPVSHWA